MRFILNKLNNGMKLYYKNNKFVLEILNLKYSNIIFGFLKLFLEPGINHSE